MRTLVGVVLDRSGSMASVLDDTIGGFNSFVEEQREQNQILPHDETPSCGGKQKYLSNSTMLSARAYAGNEFHPSGVSMAGRSWPGGQLAGQSDSGHYDDLGVFARQKVLRSQRYG